MRQTKEDLMFVNKFYTSMGQLMQKVESTGGCITGFSFAVFNEATDLRRAQIKNFAMFKEVKCLFKNNEKSLLCEWIFYVGSYCVISQAYEKTISYLEPSRDAMYGDQIVLRTNPSHSSFDNYSIAYVSSESIYKSLLFKQKYSNKDEFNLDSLYESIIEATNVDYSVEELRDVVSIDMECKNCVETVCKYPHLAKFKTDIMKCAATHDGIFDKIYPEIVRNGRKFSGFLKLNDLPQLLIVGDYLELETISNILEIDIMVITIDSVGGFGDKTIIKHCHKKNKTIIKHCHKKIRRICEDYKSIHNEIPCITLYYDKSGCFTSDHLKIKTIYCKNSKIIM
jgi:hypothetical protein